MGLNSAPAKSIRLPEVLGIMSLKTSNDGIGANISEGAKAFSSRLYFEVQGGAFYA